MKLVSNAPAIASKMKFNSEQHKKITTGKIAMQRTIKSCSLSCVPAIILTYHDACVNYDFIIIVVVVLNEILLFCVCQFLSSSFATQFHTVCTSTAKEFFTEEMPFGKQWKRKTNEGNCACFR